MAYQTKSNVQQFQYLQILQKDHHVNLKVILHVS